MVYFFPKFISLAISQSKQKLSNSYLINPFPKQEKHFGIKSRDLVTRRALLFLDQCCHYRYFVYLGEEWDIWSIFMFMI